MKQGNCEVCGRWDSALQHGVCGECINRYSEKPLAVIGIAGPARSGKDTVARFIMEALNGYTRMSFADPIKEMARVGFGFTHEQLHGDHKETVDQTFECTPRHVLQTLGTDWGREMIHPDVWVKAMEFRLVPGTIIPDVRFENEARLIRKRGVLIHVESNRATIDAGSNHVSEAGVEPEHGDFIIPNYGTLDELRENVYKCLKLTAVVKNDGITGRTVANDAV